MDINKLALELQQNQSVRQKIYAQYMNNQDDFFFQNFHGILEEKVLFEYLQHAQKHKKLMKLLPAILCFSTQTTLSARVIRTICSEKKSIHLPRFSCLSASQKASTNW